MSDKTQNIKSYKIVYPQVYSYILPNRAENDGSQKIGYTEQENVEVRILQQVKTAAATLKHETLWSAPAFFEGGKESFRDYVFHNFLVKKGIERKNNLGSEWFYFNGEPFKSKDLFDLFRKEKFSALQNENGKVEYTLRYEQEEAVKKAINYFNENEKGEFLWNAKPRFGKTLASYDLSKRLDAKKVLIVTNRPAIANSWFDDYEMFIGGYAFISETSSLNSRPTISREQHINLQASKPHFTFLSLQDLKGSKYFGGPYDKLRWVADLAWDLLIIDEAHEGIDTGRTDAAFEAIKRKHTLHLSGTPFKALANEKFPKEAIFNWTYLNEQKIKQIEIEQGESGEHTDMPDLKLFTYRISQMITNQVNEGLEIDNENFDYAFDLNEFFSAKNKKFVRENEVKDFLKNLTTNKKYPFSTPELRNELKHTFWYVGNRVDSVKALEQLLKKDPVFKDYEVIVAAGDGRTFEEEENDFKSNEKSYEKVKKAILEHDKTITLSCGQLTTGVTIKEWTAVLMLTDIKTPSLYMQAAFRAQNPYKEFRNGELNTKKSAYLFDFAPTRVLEIYDQFANGLNPKAVNGEITEKDREANISELLNFFPVISEDVNGEMIELDAEKVLTFPNALAASEIVNARFMTNLLFNDTLKGVFNFPKEVEEILNKMPEEKNKRAQKTKNTLDLDDARKVNDNKATKINENTEIILGEKIFKANTERVVDNLLKENNEQVSSDELVEIFAGVAEPLIAKYKEVYKTTVAETKEATKQIQEKVKIVAEEYNNSEIKDSADLKQKLIAILEDDFVKTKVTEKEKEVVEKVQKTKEDEIRDRLRSFTRTIPMFIMANASKEEITIDNFDVKISDEDFLDLTSITKEEFHKLRDGFDYEEDGERKTFQGVFNKYRFNASIAEFKFKKDQLANYFTADEDIFELIPNQKTNQIFTPKKVVQMMVNKLEEQDPSLFTRTDSTFIDLYMKSGMYITVIVKKLFNNTKKRYASDNECLKHILENQVFGLSPTPILQGITQSYIFGFDAENKISRNNFIQHDLTPQAKEGVAKQKLKELLNINENMKFDAIVGNPPYQITAIGTNRSPPIYHKFVVIAKSLNPNYISLITPSRWIAGGLGLSDFRKSMLKYKQIKELIIYPDSNEVFSGVEVKGGISYFLWKKDFEGYCAITTKINNNVFGPDERILDEFDILIRYTSGVNILKKILEFEEISITNILSVDKEFGWTSNFKQFSKTEVKGFIPLHYIHKTKRHIGWIDRKDILKSEQLIDTFKVLIPKAGSDGGKTMPDVVLGKPLVTSNPSVCTQSFLFFHLNTQKEANSLEKYLFSKFFRFLVSLRKITQDATKSTYEWVPLQDFTEKSDIDWSKSIPEIDQQLYVKYGLSEKEIGFIASMIKPMG
jgi:hypothetical protein